jgi:nicotinate dehydrogenase subunit B
MAAASINPGQAPSKPVSQYQLVTKVRVPRVDIPDKVTGKFTYTHNIHVPGMLHGRLVRPRGQGAYGDGTMPRIISVDESSIKHIAGARVVRRGDFLGVVAPQEYAAIQAAAQLKVKFADPPAISGSGNLWKQMRDFDAKGQAPARIAVNTGNFNSAYAAAPIKVEATYKYPYNGHMPLGPGAAVAHVTSEGALVMTGTQDAYTMRGRIATLLNLPVNKVRIQYWESGGTFGNAQVRHDTGQAAAVMSQLAGAPVKLTLMRWDEHGWDNYGPAIMADMRAGRSSRMSSPASECRRSGSIPRHNTWAARRFRRPVPARWTRRTPGRNTTSPTVA